MKKYIFDGKTTIIGNDNFDLLFVREILMRELETCDFEDKKTAIMKHISKIDYEIVDNIEASKKTE